MKANPWVAESDDAYECATLEGPRPGQEDDPLDSAVHEFSRASPELLRGRSLQRRTDTKFVVPRGDLPMLLHRLMADYAVLESGGRRLAEYRTLYFDTPDLRCFNDHRRGRSPRYKLRVRHYPDRGLSFLEIKRRSLAPVTQKFRRERDYGDNTVDPDFVAKHSPLDPECVRAQMWTNFRRITLLSKSGPERATIDLTLVFAADGRQANLPECALFEVKQPRFCSRTPIMLALRESGIRPLSLSKYCAGTVLIHPRARANRFRPSLRQARASA